jgi:hypothetical protein
MRFCGTRWASPGRRKVRLTDMEGKITPSIAIRHDSLMDLRDEALGHGALRTPRRDRPKSVPLSPNDEFYMSVGDSERIMNPAYFSKEVAQFIEDERVFLQQFFARENYECIIEVGCHTGGNSAWLSELCRHYIGVDINAPAIERAKAASAGKPNIEFVCTPAENLGALLLSKYERPQRQVVLFPFNLFGNFLRIERLLQTLDVTGLDVAVSNFNTKSATTIGRYIYYANCFSQASVRVYDAERGVLFKAGQRFQSIAFNRSYLSEVIREISDYHGVSMPFSIYGELLVLTR